MLSRLLDPHDGTPRDRVFWLLLAALAAAQLLAFYSLCLNQVRKAQDRQVVVALQRATDGECPQPVAPSLAHPCTR